MHDECSKIYLATLAERIYSLTMMTTTEITKARDISDRRIAYLEKLGEDTRNTPSWRDATAERAQLERQIAFSGWLAGSVRS
jgi:hypothetical protein